MTDLVVSQQVIHFHLTEATRQTIAFSLPETTLRLACVGPVGPKGDTGDQGPAGGTYVVMTAGADLSGHRAVRCSNGLIYYCDGDTANQAGTCIGISTTAALTGAEIHVQSFGEVTDPSFALTEGPLFVGTNGVLSTTPGNAFAQEIARVTNTDTLFMNIQPAILKV